VDDLPCCSFKGPGVLVCSIDNMPTQLPRESTDFFGDLLYPIAFDILQSDATQPLENHNFTPSVAGVSTVAFHKYTSCNFFNFYGCTFGFVDGVQSSTSRKVRCWESK
jgi:hypothetical protein